jgi:glycosyltransferase involved in cell wall biosynthesis
MPSIVKTEVSSKPLSQNTGLKPNRAILIIVENLPVPFDRRVWQEATALHEAGYEVAVICPKGKGHTASYEELQGVHVYRHSLPVEATGAMGYLVEYTAALFWEFVLSVKVLRRHGFDVIHACNPPDLIFLIGGFYKLFFRKKFVFDQHDLNPELYEVKFGHKTGLFYKLLCLFERWTFRCADASIATNETFKKIAIDRGGMDPEKVAIVKSYPDLARFKPAPPNASLRRSFTYLIGYVGIMGKQDGVDILVSAMAYIVHQMKRVDVGCMIIGSGSELENLQKQAIEAKVENFVTFTGYLSGETLLTHLCTLDIGIIPDPPSECNDKLSMNKVFEYMTLGLPFVQFDLAQSRLEAGDAGIVANGSTPKAMADAVVALLTDQPLRDRMSASGKERAHREFKWETEKASLIETYRKLFA